MAKRKKQAYEKKEVRIARLKDLIEREPGLKWQEICERLDWNERKFRRTRREYHDSISGPSGGNPIVCCADHTYRFDSRAKTAHNEWVSPRDKAIRAEVKRLNGTCDRSEQLHPGSEGVEKIRLLARQLGVSEGELMEELSDEAIAELLREAS